MQQAPWQRAIFVTYAEEAPERHYRISDLPAPLVDHYALDRPQLFSVAATNRCAFDLVARDQIGGFACLHLRSDGCHDHLLPTLMHWCGNHRDAARVPVTPSYLSDG